VGVDEGLDAGEAEAGAMGVRAGREEGLEEASAGSVVEAVAVVVERERESHGMGRCDKTDPTGFAESGAGVEGEVK